MKAAAPSVEMTPAPRALTSAAPGAESARRGRGQARHRRWGTAFMIVTGGGLEAWVKRENDLHMIHMITEATIFLAALVGKEVFRRWAARRLQGY